MLIGCFHGFRPMKLTRSMIKAILISLALNANEPAPINWPAKQHPMIAETVSLYPNYRKNRSDRRREKILKHKK